MSGIFTVTALAIAAERANAVGVVRLTCLPEGLEIELVRAAGFAPGFAPSSVAVEVSFKVPYTAVRGLVRHGRTLALALDPAVAAPHNRFALVRFTDDTAAALAHTYRARALARWVSYIAPAPLGALAAYAAPRSLVSGALGTAAVGVVCALVAWAALSGLVRWLTWGGPISDQYRDALEVELSRRLGLLPAKAMVSTPWGGSAPEGEIAVTAGSPRKIGAWAIVAIATIGLVAVMAFLKRYTGPPPKTARAPIAEGAAGIGPAASVVSHVEMPEPGSDRPRCACERADSPLWSDGVPALSVLLFDQPDDASGVVTPTIPEGRKKKRPRFNFDLAVVNNASRPVRDVRVVVTFARRNERDERVGVTDRGLFWAGDLGPGRAVKWHVRAPGTEMKIEPSVAGTLDAIGAEPAPPDAYFDLLSSRYRIVRVHAAMMLAYLRDPRAESAARLLSGSASSKGDEALTLSRIERASRPVIACDVKKEGALLEACVFNGSAAPVKGLSLVALPPPPSIEKGASFEIEGSVAVHEGSRVAFHLDRSGALRDKIGEIIVEHGNEPNKREEPRGRERGQKRSIPDTESSSEPHNPELTDDASDQSDQRDQRDQTP